MDREFDFFHQIGQFQVPWTGVVEDRNDPAFMGRIRVRIFGVHSTDRTEVPTETLPWATPLFPSTSASFGGIGATASGLIEGTWVMGFFRDGFSCQDPIIFGPILSSSSPKWTGTQNMLKQSNIYNKTAGSIENNIVPSTNDLTDIQNESFGKKLMGFGTKIQEKTSEITKEILKSIGITNMDGFKDHALETEEFEEQINSVSESIAEQLILELEPEIKTHFKIDEIDSDTKNNLKTELEDDTKNNLKELIIEYQRNK
jgi:hypothetical protein